MKLVAPAVLVLFSVSCRNTPVRPAFNYPADIGIAIEKTGSTCLYISNTALSPGQRVRFVNASTPPTEVEAAILGRADDRCKDSDPDHPGATHYFFKTIRGDLDKGAPAFAIANFTKPVTLVQDGATADLDGDGQLEFFRTCTSTEGVHLTIWKGKPLTGQRKWHYYYYLGYDVTPSCTESETKPEIAR